MAKKKNKKQLKRAAATATATNSNPATAHPDPPPEPPRQPRTHKQRITKPPRFAWYSGIPAADAARLAAKRLRAQQGKGAPRPRKDPIYESHLREAQAHPSYPPENPDAEKSPIPRPGAVMIRRCCLGSPSKYYLRWKNEKLEQYKALEREIGRRILGTAEFEEIFDSELEKLRESLFGSSDGPAGS